MKRAFTLAETLITLTILGVVAAITLPYLIQKYNEATNRTKVKKAMAAYEKVVGQMVVENNIAGSIKSIFPFGQCDESSKYFKTINILAGYHNCRFQTSDKVWWDISDIERPVISVNGELSDELVDMIRSNPEEFMDDETMFMLFGEYDNNGILRINDQADTLLSANEKAYLKDLYSFAMPEKAGGSSTTTGILGSPYSSLSDFPECTNAPKQNCVWTNPDYNGHKIYYINDNTYISAYSPVDEYYYIINEEMQYFLSNCTSPGVDCGNCYLSTGFSNGAGTCPNKVNGVYNFPSN